MRNSSKRDADNKIRDEKINLMRERQAKWMRERNIEAHSSNQGDDKTTVSKNGKSGRSLSANSKSTEGTSWVTSTKHDRGKGSRQLSDTKIVMWAAKDVESDSFVVRSKTATQSKGKPTKSKGRDNYQLGISKDHSVDDTRDRFTSHQNMAIPQRKSDTVVIERPNIDKLFDTDSSVVVSDAVKDTIANAVDGEIPGFERKRRNSEDTSAFPSHKCPSCRLLMDSPEREPMICIPCAHSVCLLCLSRLKQCPVCRCNVQSSSQNAALKAVIKECKDMQKKKELERKEQEARKYVEEYETLTLRSQVLREETEMVINEMETVTISIAQKQEKMTENERKTEKLRTKIEELKCQLTTCEAENVNHRKELSGLEKEYGKLKNHLDILEDTVETITKSKDRVKVLISSFAPGLKLDEES